MTDRVRSLWEEQLDENPGHSTWYIERFRTMAKEGADLVGEARLIDAMVPRNSRVLDAGCGPGRVGGYLHQQGHTVVGVDLDPVLIAAAIEDHPGPTWLVEDLSELDLPGRGVDADFDVIVCAGNVMAFAAPSTRPEILQRFVAHLKEGGRAVIGFGSGRGYAFEDFRADAAAAGLREDALFSTWDLRPYAADGDFVVAILARP